MTPTPVLFAFLRAVDLGGVNQVPMGKLMQVPATARNLNTFRRLLERFAA